MTDRYPFANEREEKVWIEQNCSFCTKANKRNGNARKCLIRTDLASYADKGEVTLRTYGSCSRRDCPYRKARHDKFDIEKAVVWLREGVWMHGEQIPDDNGMLGSSNVAVVHNDCSEDFIDAFRRAMLSETILTTKRTRR